MKPIRFCKFLSLILALLMVTALLSPLGVQAAGNSGSCSATVKWKFDPGTGTLTISGTGEMPDFGWYTQPYNSLMSSIKAVVVEEGITRIGDYAFVRSKAASITLPDSVTSIGTFAFSDCPIKSIQLPPNVTEIESYVFSGTELESIVLPEGVVSIANNAFSDCTSMKSITIPTTLESIGHWAFEYCNALEAVNISDMAAWCNITYKNCQASDSSPLMRAGHLYLNGELVTDPVIPEGVTELDGSFAGCTDLRTVTMPDTLTTIGSDAFYECTNLEAVLIPESVTKVDSQAFYNCTNLGTVCYRGSEEAWNGVSVGSSNYSLTDATFIFDYAGDLKDAPIKPADPNSGSCSATVKWKFDPGTGTLTISGTGKMPDFGWYTQPYNSLMNSIKAVVVEEGITRIGDYAFVRSKAASITLPDSVTSIGTFAFSDCPIKSIQLPPNVTEIESYVFSGTELESIVLPEGVVSIANNAFSDCTSMKSITIPTTLKSIGHWAFEYCNALEAVNISDMAAWCNITYKNCQASDSSPLMRAGHLYLNGELVTDPVIPEGVTELDGSFAGCTDLRTVSMPDTLTTIGSDAFYNCKNLEAVLIPESVTKVDFQAFMNCMNLETVYYTGTEDQWAAMSVASTNYPLFDANKIYNHTGEIPCLDVVTRVFGADRYATSFKAADTLKSELGVEKFQNMIVASGTGFADALAGSYLAAVKEAPILLVRGANVNDVKNYIKQNLTSGGTVYLLGGVNAVPKTMESGLDGYNVKRLGGADRYETNLLILKEAGVGNKDIIVCTGLNFADSLSASASGLPILLVKGGLTDTQKAFLKGTSGKKIIVGGTSAVSGTVEKQLASYGSVKRLAGDTRYDTSVLVAKEFFSAPKTAVLAYAQNFPDGLSGGPLAYVLKAPLILTDNKKPAPAVAFATGLGIKSGYVLGGTGLISDKVAKNIFSMAASDAILVK